MAAMAVKPDFPPLLAPGYHHLDLAAIQRLCVDAYPNVQIRRYLFQYLEQTVQDLLIQNIPCKIWIDGSFMTEHPAPDDLDIIVILDYDVANSLSESQREFIDKLNNEGYNYPRVDSWVISLVPRGDDLFEEIEEERQGFAELYNVEHSGRWLKGVALIVLGETDVGLSISS